MTHGRRSKRLKVCDLYRHWLTLDTLIIGASQHHVAFHLCQRQIQKSESVIFPQPTYSLMLIMREKKWSWERHSDPHTVWEPHTVKVAISALKAKNTVVCKDGKWYNLSEPSESLSRETWNVLTKMWLILWMTELYDAMMFLSDLGLNKCGKTKLFLNLL